MIDTTTYYGLFAEVYDILAPDIFYREAKKATFSNLDIENADHILDLCCGTGQNFSYVIPRLRQESILVGADFSPGMLRVARRKKERLSAENLQIIKADVTEITLNSFSSVPSLSLKGGFDITYCTLGLTAIPDWKKVINNMIQLTRPGGKIVLMDWYMEDLNILGHFINLIGKADISRPTWQYLESKTNNFEVDRSFNWGKVYVAVGEV